MNGEGRAPLQRPFWQWIRWISGLFVFGLLCAGNAQAINLIAAVVNSSYSNTFGVPSYEATCTDGFSVSGTIPGMTFSSTGTDCNVTLSGTPTWAGTFGFTITSYGMLDGVSDLTTSFTLVVEKLSPNLSMSAAPASAAFGSTINFPLALMHGYLPSGSVTIYDGATPVGSGSLTTTSATTASAMVGLNTLSVGSHTLTAVYTGDSNNESVSSNGVTVTITQAMPGLSVSASAGSIAYGATTTLTATLTGGSSPSGTVTFKDGSTAIGTGTVTGGTASFTTTSLGVGNHTITAIYSGDANNGVAISGATTITVSRATPIISLSAAPASPSIGSIIALTASLSGAGLPSGQIIFMDGATTLGTATISGSAALFSISSLSVGSHSITAIYGGDANNTNATSSAISVTVVAATPGISVSASPTSINFGSTTTLTATIGGGLSPSGTVTFMEGATILGTVTISNSTAMLTVSSLSPGNHSVIAVYSGDVNNAQATSGAISVTVGQVTSSVSLIASPASTSVGSAVTLTATVTGSSPTGSVIFSEGSTTLGTANLSSGTATFAISTLALGSHSITARYGGDSNNAGATSGNVNVSIGKSSPTIALSASTRNLSEKQSLTLTATLSGGSSPTGSISFKDGGTILGTANLSGLSAALVTSTLAVGSHGITAVYNGDSNNNSLGSSVITVSVASIGPTVESLSPASGSALGGSRITLGGSHLGGASSVSFGGAAAKIVSSSDTEVVVLAPAHASGAVDVVVVALTGTMTLANGFTYAPLPNPTNNAAVAAVVRAQTTAVHQFARAHLTNFTQRLESLHGDGAGLSSFGLSFGNTNGASREPTTWARGGDIVSYQGSELAYLRAGLRPTATGSPNATLPVAEDDNLPDLPNSNGAGNRKDVAWWISGALDLANQRASGSQGSSRLSTSGISFGGDYRFGRQLTLGVGAGYSRSRYRADDDSASSNGQGIMGVVYASLRPMDDLYVDLLAGYGALHFDLARLIADTGATAAGTRSGHQAFGSATVGYEWRGQDWLVSPYVRVDIARASLDRYTESGGPGALTYLNQSVHDDAAYLGVRGEYRIAVPLGTLTPQARVAYQHSLQGGGQATMTYADPTLSSPIYTYSDSPQDSKQWLLTLGGRLLFKSGVTLTLLYTHNAANALTSSQSVNLSVSGRF